MEEPGEAPLLRLQDVPVLLREVQGFVSTVGVRLLVLLLLVSGVTPVAVEPLPEPLLLLPVRTREVPDVPTVCQWSRRREAPEAEEGRAPEHAAVRCVVPRPSRLDSTLSI